MPEGGLASPDEYGIGTISMPLWSEISESTLYADDTCEVVWGDSSSECHDRAQEVADKLSEWFTCVGLSLNPKKSEYSNELRSGPDYSQRNAS